MTKSQLMERVLAGEPLVLVEYRHSNAEIIKWRDKETKQALEAPTLRHTVETSRGSMAVQERVADSFNPQAYTPPFKKGQKAVLKFTVWQSQKGAVTANGILEPYDDSK